MRTVFKTMPYKNLIYCDKLFAPEKGRTSEKNSYRWTEADLTKCYICGFQARFEDILSPKVAMYW